MSESLPTMPSATTTGTTSGQPSVTVVQRSWEQAVKVVGITDIVYLLDEFTLRFHLKSCPLCAFDNAVQNEEKPGKRYSAQPLRPMSPFEGVLLLLSWPAWGKKLHRKEKRFGHPLPNRTHVLAVSRPEGKIFPGIIAQVEYRWRMYTFQRQFPNFMLMPIYHTMFSKDNNYNADYATYCTAQRRTPINRFYSKCFKRIGLVLETKSNRRPASVKNLARALCICKAPITDDHFIHISNILPPDVIARCNEIWDVEKEKRVPTDRNDHSGTDGDTYSDNDSDDHNESDSDTETNA
ncbi:hypothetical protein MBANPS3_011485 [Mucor bainieri]